MLYIREDIAARVLSHNLPSTESFYCQNNTPQEEMTLNCSSSPNKNNIKSHVKAFFIKYENIFLLGDFNACVDDETMKDFGSSYCLKSLTKQPTNIL